MALRMPLTEEQIRECEAAVGGMLSALDVAALCGEIRRLRELEATNRRLAEVALEKISGMPAHADEIARLKEKSTNDDILIGQLRAEVEGKSRELDQAKLDYEEQGEELHVALLQVDALKKALIAECRREACDANECYGGYQKCSGCERRAKAALGEVTETRKGVQCPRCPYMMLEGGPCTKCGYVEKKQCPSRTGTDDCLQCVLKAGHAEIWHTDGNLIRWKA